VKIEELRKHIGEFVVVENPLGTTIERKLKLDSVQRAPLDARFDTCVVFDGQRYRVVACSKVIKVEGDG